MTNTRKRDISNPARDPAESRRRAGTTLVEMLVVITIAAVMMGIGVTTIHLLLGAEHEATRSVRFTASLARLARVFRDDVHAARHIELPEIEPGKPAVLVAELGEGRQVRYELDAHLATRLETGAAGQTRRDVFYFPPRSRLGFERAENQRLVRIEIEMPVGAPPGVPRPQVPGQGAGVAPKTVSDAVPNAAPTARESTRPRVVAIEAAHGPARRFEVLEATRLESGDRE